MSAASGAVPINERQGTLFVLRFNVLAASGQAAFSFRDPATNKDTFFLNDGAAVKTSDGSLTANETGADRSIGGRITGIDGRPVFKAQVTLTDENGNVRHAVTNQLGYYRFAGAQVGRNYVLGATHKQFRFDSQNISRSENQNEINFVAWNLRLKITASFSFESTRKNTARLFANNRAVFFLADKRISHFLFLTPKIV